MSASTSLPTYSLCRGHDLTEADWLTCDDPAELVASLPGKPDGRKLLLFASACCRRVGDLLTGPLSRGAIEVAERCADGLASCDELVAAAEAATGAAYRSTFRYA